MSGTIYLKSTSPLRCVCLCLLVGFMLKKTCVSVCVYTFADKRPGWSDENVARSPACVHVSECAYVSVSVGLLGFSQGYNCQSNSGVRTESWRAAAAFKHAVCPLRWLIKNKYQLINRHTNCPTNQSRHCISIKSISRSYRCCRAYHQFLPPVTCEAPVPGSSSPCRVPSALFL